MTAAARCDRGATSKTTFRVKEGATFLAQYLTRTLPAQAKEPDVFWQWGCDSRRLEGVVVPL